MNATKEIDDTYVEESFEEFKARVEKELQGISEKLEIIENKIKNRYFRDPVAWEMINSLDGDAYFDVIECAGYHLACEIQGKPAMTAKEFYTLPMPERAKLTDAADDVIVKL